MTIRITVSDRALFRVRCTVTTDTGAAEQFEFKALGKRLKPAALSAMLTEGRKTDDFLPDVIVGWQGVVDGEGNDVPFSAEALKQLLENIPGLDQIIASAYVAETRAKEKN